MREIRSSREQTLKDMIKYLEITPKEKRPEWLKDGEKWLEDYYKRNSKR